MEFLRANGIEDSSFRDVDYQEVLNAQVYFTGSLLFLAIFQFCNFRKCLGKNWRCSLEKKRKET